MEVASVSKILCCVSSSASSVELQCNKNKELNMGQFDPKEVETTHNVHKDVTQSGLVSSTSSQPVKYGELVVLG